MNSIDKAVDDALKSCGNITKHGCMNIIVSVKLNELKQKGIISSFQIVNESTIRYSFDM